MRARLEVVGEVHFNSAFATLERIYSHMSPVSGRYRSLFEMVYL